MEHDDLPVFDGKLLQRFRHEYGGGGRIRRRGWPDRGLRLSLWHPICEDQSKDIAAALPIDVQENPIQPGEHGGLAAEFGSCLKGTEGGVFAFCERGMRRCNRCKLSALTSLRIHVGGSITQPAIGRLIWHNHRERNRRSLTRSSLAAD